MIWGFATATVLWIALILALGDLALFLAGASVLVLVVIAVTASVEQHFRDKPFVVPHGKKRVGLR